MEILNIFLTIILIIVVKASKKDNKGRIIGYNIENGKPVFDRKIDEQPIAYDIYTGAPIYKEKENKKTKKLLTEDDKSKIANTFLMITGAFLVVVAAIIFLASSWEVTSGLLKTFILIALQVVFIGFSFASLKVFNLEKASKIFKDLALIFVPIVLVSLSAFELIGSYFSNGGEGQYLYLGITFLLSDIIYRIYGKLRKDKTVKVYAFISEILAIISFTAFMSHILENILLILSIYNIIYYILLQGDYLDKDYNLPNIIFSYVLVAINVFSLLADIDNNLILHINILLYSIYFFIRQTKEKDETNQKVYTILYLSCYFFFLNIISAITISPYFIYLIALIPLLLLTKIIKNESAKKVLIYVVGALGLIISYTALCSQERTVYYLLTFIVSTILYSLLYYLEKNSVFKYAAYFFFTTIFMNLCYVTEYNEFIKYIPLLTIPLCYSLEVIVESLKDDASKSVFLLALALESFLLTGNYAVIIVLLLAIALVKLEKINEYALFVPLLNSLSIFSMDDNIYTKIACIVLISTYTFLSLTKRKFNVYSIISLLSIFLSSFIFEIHNIILCLLIIVWSILHYVIGKKKNVFYEIMIILGFLGLYFSILGEFEIAYMSIYPLGYFVAAMAVTKLVIEEESGIKDFFEYFFILIITVASSFIVKDSMDSLLFISILLIMCIFSFTMRWRNYSYASLISIVASVIYVTIEFWQTIPWYIYILIVGFTLIILAMIQEKRKDKNKVQNK